MDEELIKQLAIDFCLGNKPYAQLETELDKLNWTEQLDFYKWCQSYAERAATVAAYAYSRSYGRDHNCAVKAMNNKRTKIRRAMGFTYPKDNIAI